MMMMSFFGSFLLLVAILSCGNANQGYDRKIKNQLSDLHYQLFKTVQNRTSLVKMVVFETECTKTGCTFNGCHSDERSNCGNEMMKKLQEIQNTVNTMKNAENKPKGCKSGWKSYKGHCYVFIRSRRNWFDAQMTCRENGATLVQINDAQENRWIMRNFPKVRFWLDHSDVGTEGSWKLFSTGKAPTFSNWAPGQPNDYRKAQDCGYAYHTKNGAWDDSGCAYKISFICESSGSRC
ncbi:perlucin-like protein [Ostrea edulis]|uniref:perlucin-like protein n=1 Tax=Ostrea edulis TaxID=37623 RepID=UPI0024AFB977|nr:perlucin-like protein [Ostrea edulis]